MKNKLRKIHRRIRKCKKCKDILKNKVLPRSGFPPRDFYEAVIIGAEPGPGAKGMMTPTEYEKKFMPWAINKNRVRLLFEDLNFAGVDYSKFFYTNAVKCPAKPKKGSSKSRECFKNCEAHLKNQLDVIKPKFLVVFGSAASLLQIKRSRKNTIERDKYMKFPAIVIRHPQGASKDYRKRVTRRINRALNHRKS